MHIHNEHVCRFEHHIAACAAHSIHVAKQLSVFIFINSIFTICTHRFDTDKDLFLKHVTAAVDDSQQRIYTLPAPTCPLVFTEPRPEHEELLKKILQTALTDRDVLTRGMDMDLDTGSAGDSGIKKERGTDESATDISTDSVSMDAFKSPMS
ncbi:hypothetical protein EON65_50480 [archaeon]|nr:MAG: hypothetical protein EON65_50480 [archaeon]